MYKVKSKGKSRKEFSCNNAIQFSHSAFETRNLDTKFIKIYDVFFLQGVVYICGRKTWKSIYDSMYVIFFERTSEIPVNNKLIEIK